MSGCIRGTYGCVGGLMNSIYMSSTPRNGKREVMLWTAAMGLAIDEENANIMADKYITEWKGKFPSDIGLVQVSEKNWQIIFYPKFRIFANALD